MNRPTALAVIPSLPVRVVEGGRVTITRKFIDGMELYRNLWGDSVTAFMEPIHAPTSNLDEEEFDIADLPFRLEVVSYKDPKLGQLLAGHRIALASLYSGQAHLSRVCQSVGVPCVYVSEYALQTRWQVVQSERNSPYRWLKQHVWELDQERRYRAAVRIAAGIQCNGTPTFEAYRRINPRPLLYFDTRVDESMLITDAELAERTAELERGNPLRLLFSGRLIEMKGADHLVQVAEALRKRGVAFEMIICGGGTLEPTIRAEVDRLGLNDQFKLVGVLPFKSELVPLTKRWADLFVCCHRTGDPSCTYLEVMSCGVPIVGYANEAFAGVVRESGVGWVEPMNQPNRIADRIADLANHRQALAQAARDAVAFGRRHTFDRTFQSRIDHMKACSPQS